MNAAISFYEQPRYIKQCGSNIISNIIEPNDCKIFGHFWWDNSYIGQKFKFHATDIYEHDMISEFKSCYPESNIFWEPQRDFDISKYDFRTGEMSLELADRHREMWSREVIFKQKSAITSMCKSLLLTNYYEPDIIFLTRTDVLPTYPLQEMYIEDDTIYIDQFDNPNQIADWIIVGNLNTMRKFSEFSELIDDVSQYKVLTTSNLIRYLCKRVGLRIEKRYLGVSIYRNYKSPKHMNEYSEQNKQDWPHWMK